MRIHVYSQELTSETDLVVKVADTGRRFYGVRFVLRSPDALHHTTDDDDRSAVTFWCADDGRTFDRFKFAQVLEQAAAQCRRAAREGK